MKTQLFKSCLFASAIFLFSCQPQPVGLSDSQKAAITDSVRTVLRSILTSSDKLDFPAAFQFYTNDTDARYTENGVLFPSLDAMKKSYAEFAPIIESLQNNVDAWDVVVLGPYVVSFTLPIHFSMKTKGRPLYKGQYVWSGVIQRRGGNWKMVQTHESWVNFDHVMAAIMPAHARLN